MLIQTLPPSEAVVLRDGSRLTLRPIRPDDAPRLQALHARLSPESIYFRFLGWHPALSEQEAQQFANLDYHTRMAFAALNEENGEEKIVAVARYAACLPDHPDEADAAIVVEDRCQNLGLGTLLLDRLLAYGRAHGIAAFRADINPENERMLRFIRRSGLPATSKLTEGALEIRIGIN